MMQKQAVKANSEYILPLKINYILINLNNVYNINRDYFKKTYY